MTNRLCCVVSVTNSTRPTKATYLMAVRKQKESEKRLVFHSSLEKRVSSDATSSL